MSIAKTDININYEADIFKGDTLVFLHGIGGDLSIWRYEREFFSSKKISTVAIDLRGHGLSGRPQEHDKYALENFAKDIYAVLKQENIHNPIIAGHCFGGVVALAFHKLYPKYAKAYILIDSTYKAPLPLKVVVNNPHIKNLIHRILKLNKVRDRVFQHVDFDKFVGNKDINLKRLYSDIKHTGLNSWIFTYETLAGFDGTKILESIIQPVLLIQGEDDKIIQSHVTWEMHKLIKDSRLNLIPDANHIIVINNPEEIKRSMMSFLKALKPEVYQ